MKVSPGTTGWNAGERRLLFMEKRDAEQVLDNVGKPRVALPSVENNVQELFRKMEGKLGNIGILRSIVSGGANRARDLRVESVLDEAAQREIETRTNAAVSWIGGFVKRRKYREYVALRHAVKERMRAEVEEFVRARQERLESLAFAAGVAAKLRNVTSFVSAKGSEANLQLALGRVRVRLQEKRQKDEKMGMEIPEEWQEAARSEAILRRELLRFGVLDPRNLEAFLQGNADGRKDLINHIKAHPFLDPDDPPPQRSHEQERALCLQIARKLQTGFWSRASTGYRNLRLTAQSGNALPLSRRLQALSERGDAVGSVVEFTCPGIGVVQAFVVARDAQFPEALILRGGGSAHYVLDTKTGRLTYRDAVGAYKHFLLTESTFSFLAS